MIPEEKINEIRQASRISEFISPHVSLKRRGSRSIMGLCPFHNEKSPSFSVNDENGFYHCFGCGASGNVFKFLMEIEGLSFPESVRKVAARYNIDVPESSDPRVRSRASLYDVNASAARYFRRCLLETPAGKPMLDYLVERGVGEAAGEQFLIGASPNSGDGLVRWFAREGIDPADPIKVGLLGQRGNRIYDRFRNRLMFPIRDTQGRVIGFGGRRIGDGDGPKYLNSPESEVYRKSRALYGLYEARKALRNLDELVLVEGYMDVIALAEAGMENAVATCGTALTIDQARIMRRHASEVVALFDSDDAGQAAAARSFPLFIEAGIWSRAASLPDGEDPDSFVRKNGLDALNAAIRKGTPLAEAYMKHRVTSAPSGTSGLAHAAADVAELLAKVADPFEFEILLSKAALWTNIPEDELRRQATRRKREAERRARSGQRQGSQARRPSGPEEAPHPADAAPGGGGEAGFDRFDTTERGEDTPAPPPPKGAPGPEELIACALLAGPEDAESLVPRNLLESMENGVWKALVSDIIERARGGVSPDPAELADTLPEQYRKRVMPRLMDGSMTERSIRAKIVKDCLAKIEERARRVHNRMLLAELRRREELGVDDNSDDGLSDLRPRKRPNA